jgi:hypothetical protein
MGDQWSGATFREDRIAERNQMTAKKTTTKKSRSTGATASNWNKPAGLNALGVENSDDSRTVAEALVNISRILDKLTPDQRKRAIAATGTLYGFAAKFHARNFDVWHFRGTELIYSNQPKPRRDSKGRFASR